MSLRSVLLAMLVFAAVLAHASDEASSKTVLGPRNIYLADGTEALMAGDAETGVPLTLRGLEIALGSREIKLAHANLCAGFIMLHQLETALVHCDWVLERDENHWRTYNNRAIAYLHLGRYEESEADIKKGQELAPRAETLKEVKGMYLDEVKPVDARITIDDRRNEPQLPVNEPE